jgi:arsenate reductase-like glutaredoxin family protein
VRRQPKNRPFQAIDLGHKGMSAGELRNVAARVGGVERLMDRDGKRYLERGLKYAAPTGARIEQMLLDDPLLIRTPVVRDGARATVGYSPEIWLQWIAEAL